MGERVASVRVREFPNHRHQKSNKFQIENLNSQNRNPLKLLYLRLTNSFSVFVRVHLWQKAFVAWF